MSLLYRTIRHKETGEIDEIVGEKYKAGGLFSPTRYSALFLNSTLAWAKPQNYVVLPPPWKFWQKPQTFNEQGILVNA